MATCKAIVGAITLGLAVSLTAWAAQAIAVQPGKAVGNVALGIQDTTAISQLSKLLQKPSAVGKDTEYEGQTVYYAYFGAKNADNLYPLQVYSDVHRKVFIFEINSDRFVTPEGIHVGSSEADLTKAYGSQLKAGKPGRLYTKYTLGGRKGTDFFVRNHSVNQILIRDY